MGTMVAGAFDFFAHAKAAADALNANGFADAGVQITSNPRNPDGMPGTSLVDEVAKLPVAAERLFFNLFDIGEDETSARVRSCHVRDGGIVVSVPVECATEKIIALNILRMHRGIEIDHAKGGVPLY